MEYSGTNVHGTHLPTPGGWTADHELAGSYVRKQF